MIKTKQFQKKIITLTFKGSSFIRAIQRRQDLYPVYIFLPDALPFWHLA